MEGAGTGRRLPRLVRRLGKSGATSQGETGHAGPAGCCRAAGRMCGGGAEIILSVKGCTRGCSADAQPGGTCQPSDNRRSSAGQAPDNAQERRRRRCGINFSPAAIGHKVFSRPSRGVGVAGLGSRRRLKKSLGLLGTNPITPRTVASQRVTREQESVVDRASSQRRIRPARQARRRSGRSRPGRSRPAGPERTRLGSPLPRGRRGR